jgi:RNA polymerase sigma-70 factor (ECF subfamily)
MTPDRASSTAIDWDQAVRAHGARVVASLLAMSIPLDQADELASQAWERLIERERAGQLPEIKLPGLVLKQARFLALDWLRERRRQSALTDEIACAPDDPERALIARRDVATALRVLAASSSSARAVFYHLYDDPPPPHEVVAARVGLSVQRVRQILCEVRKRIREALEQKS